MLIRILGIVVFVGVFGYLILLMLNITNIIKGRTNTQGVEVQDQTKGNMVRPEIVNYGYDDSPGYFYSVDKRTGAVLLQYRTYDNNCAMIQLFNPNGTPVTPEQLGLPALQK